MKKLILVYFFILTTNVIAQSIETWEWQGYSIGQNANSSAYTSEAYMPEVQLINGQYIMYYTGRYNNVSAILYAVSNDLSSWTVMDTILVGFSDSTNREFEVGGASIVRTYNGQYRLFYRCSSKTPTDSIPQYHIRSAISNDGIHFSREGIRIEIQPYLANSYFILAGQSAFYKDINGEVKAIITGIDSSIGSGEPAQLYAAASPDEGLSWTNFVPLYANGHDAVVIKDSLGIYQMYFSYLAQGHRKAFSLDGIGWSLIADSILLIQDTLALTEESAPYHIADLGAVVDSSGKTILFSNYKPHGLGPWENICYYSMTIASALSEAPVNNNNICSFIDPYNHSLNFNSKSLSGESNIQIFSMDGRKIYENTFAKELNINLKEWKKGIYFYYLKNNNGMVTNKILIN